MLYVLYIKLKLRFQSFIWCRSASRANRCPIFSSPLKMKNLKFFNHIYVVKIFFCILFFVKFFFHLLILQQLNYLKKYFKVIFVLYFFINNLLNITYRTSIFQTRLHTSTLTSSRPKNNEVMRLKFQEINTHIFFNILWKFHPNWTTCQKRFIAAVTMKLSHCGAWSKFIPRLCFY